MPASARGRRVRRWRRATDTGALDAEAADELDRVEVDLPAPLPRLARRHARDVGLEQAPRLVRAVEERREDAVVGRCIGWVGERAAPPPLRAVLLAAEVRDVLACAHVVRRPG